MAFTRKMLKAMGIEEEKIDEIIEAHREVADALKEDRDKYKADADKLADTEKELKDLKNMVDGADSYKEQYEKEHKAFEEFKKGVEAEKSKAKKVDAYKDLLLKAGVSEKRIDAIVKVTSMDDIELDDNGEIKDADKRIEGIKTEWSEFIVTEKQRGANTENPPSNTGGDKMTRAEIFKKDEHGRYVLSAAERQRAIAESLSE